MMTSSERNAFIGANVRPRVKAALQRYVDMRRTGDPKASMSRVIEEAIREKLEQAGVKIEEDLTPYQGEPLPFEEETVL